MNKEFRSWDGKKFAFSEDCHGEGVPAWALSEFFEWATYDAVQQHTGLTDSTGKKIFEGDILKWDDASGGKYWRVAQVIWNPKGCWTFRTIPNKCVGSMTSHVHDFNMGSFIYTPNTSEHDNVMEVLGNIFENPEFLK